MKSYTIWHSTIGPQEFQAIANGFGRVVYLRWNDTEPWSKCNGKLLVKNIASPKQVGEMDEKDLILELL